MRRIALGQARPGVGGVEGPTKTHETCGTGSYQTNQLGWLKRGQHRCVFLFTFFHKVSGFRGQPHRLQCFLHFFPIHLPIPSPAQNVRENLVIPKPPNRTRIALGEAQSTWTVRPAEPFGRLVGQTTRTTMPQVSTPTHLGLSETRLTRRTPVPVPNGAEFGCCHIHSLDGTKKHSWIRCKTFSIGHGTR